MRTAPSPARNQSHLRAQITAAENMQAIRRAAVDARKRELDAMLARYERELDNLRAQRTIGVVA